MLMLCTRKVEDLCNWIFIIIYDAIAMITIFCTVVLSTDPGNDTVTQEFCLLVKVGALHYLSLCSATIYACSVLLYILKVLAWCSDIQVVLESGLY
jgi:hypothetical protein